MYKCGILWIWILFHHLLKKKKKKKKEKSSVLSSSSTTIRRGGYRLVPESELYIGKYPFGLSIQIMMVMMLLLSKSCWRIVSAPTIYTVSTLPYLFAQISNNPNNPNFPPSLLNSPIVYPYNIYIYPAPEKVSPRPRPSWTAGYHTGPLLKQVPRTVAG